MICNLFFRQCFPNEGLSAIIEKKVRYDRRKVVKNMDTELTSRLRGQKLEQWEAFLRRAGLDADHGVETTALIWDGDELIACGSRQRNVLKCIAVDPARQGEGLTATLLTALRQDAVKAGHRHLFLYTKPQNQAMFASLFFYPIARTDKVLLMENVRGGIGSFLDSLEAPCWEGNIGAIVMHCNPFTRGHRWLIEQAAGECDHLYLFILSEDRGLFPAADRLELVRRGTADLPNVTVHPTGPYLISSATFPTYFLKDKAKAEDVHCALDIAVFTKYFVPHFGIARRYLGTEPNCPVTGRYNELLIHQLPPAGVALSIFDRLEDGGTPISASAVRGLLGQGRPEDLHRLVPDTTFDYLVSHNMI